MTAPDPDPLDAALAVAVCAGLLAAALLSLAFTL